MNLKYSIAHNLWLYKTKYNTQVIVVITIIMTYRERKKEEEKNKSAHILKVQQH